MRYFYRIYAFAVMICLSFFLPSFLNAARFQDETLHYSIRYKWGAIRKETATATLSLRNINNDYQLTLTARTLPWADRFFEVRDTLKSIVAQKDFIPKSYTKISHEGRDYGKDELSFSKGANSMKANARRTRVNSKGERSESTQALAAVGAGYDMLSVFYYLRLLDFNKLTSGKLTKVNIFSGTKVETLTIRGLGKENVVMPDKRKMETYKIGFTFTTHGGKKSSDNITAWISADSRHIPVKLIGKLPVGEVQVYLTGN